MRGALAVIRSFLPAFLALTFAFSPASVWAKPKLSDVFAYIAERYSEEGTKKNVDLYDLAEKLPDEIRGNLGIRIKGFTRGLSTMPYEEEPFSNQTLEEICLRMVWERAMESQAEAFDAPTQRSFERRMAELQSKSQLYRDVLKAVEIYLGSYVHWWNRFALKEGAWEFTNRFVGDFFESSFLRRGKILETLQ